MEFLLRDNDKSFNILYFIYLDFSFSLTIGTYFNCVWLFLYKNNHKQWFIELLLNKFGPVVLFKLNKKLQEAMSGLKTEEIKVCWRLLRQTKICYRFSYAWSQWLVHVFLISWNIVLSGAIFFCEAFDVFYFKSTCL